MSGQAWVTLVIGLVGFGGVFWTVNQRDRADRRDQWWKRATWAVDHTFSEREEQQVVGFEVLAELQNSKLISAEERRLLTAFGLETNPDDSRRDPRDNGDVDRKDGEP